MRHFLFAVIVIALAGISCKDSNPVSVSSQCDSDAKLIGNWHGTEGIDTFSFFFTANTYIWREGLTDDPSSVYQYDGTYCLDTNPVPHTIDMHITHDNTNQAIGLLQKGIYAISLDTLLISAPPPSINLRPSRFELD